MRAAILLLWILSGCSATGAISSLDAAKQATPGVLSDVEALKNDLALAQIGGCVALLQGSNALIRGMAQGSPGLPIK